MSHGDWSSPTLSATGSRNDPKSDTIFIFLARNPSTKSVMQDSTNIQNVALRYHVEQNASLGEWRVAIQQRSCSTKFNANEDISRGITAILAIVSAFGMFRTSTYLETTLLGSLFLARDIRTIWFELFPSYEIIDEILVLHDLAFPKYNPCRMIGAFITYDATKHVCNSADSIRVLKCIVHRFKAQSNSVLSLHFVW